MEDVAYFRASAAALVVNEDGLVLGLERTDVPGSWQAPQGGIRSHEQPIEAVVREVLEETGIESDQLVLLAEYPWWLSYELPLEHRSQKTGWGQVQRWFLFRSSATPRLPAPGDAAPEFTAWRWMRMSELAEAVWRPRRSIYRLLATRWGEYFADAD